MSLKKTGKKVWEERTKPTRNLRPGKRTNMEFTQPVHPLRPSTARHANKDIGRGIRSTWVQVPSLILTNLSILVSTSSPSENKNADTLSTTSSTTVRNKRDSDGLSPLPSATKVEGLRWCTSQIPHKTPGWLLVPEASKLGQSRGTFSMTILLNGLRGQWNDVAAAHDSCVSQILFHTTRKLFSYRTVDKTTSFYRNWSILNNESHFYSLSLTHASN